MNNDLGNPLSLGTAKISKLLAYYALPSVITMITSSIYNIVDSIFIGHGVGAMAISGLAVTFPLMNLMTAFGTLVGVGAAALTSIKIGQKDYNTAVKLLSNLVILNISLGLVVMVIGLAFLKPILTLFGASETLLPYAYDYMRYILYGNIITHLYFGLNSLLRSSGYPRLAMIIPLITIVLNCILDALFIFVFHLGIKGAAIATVIAQVFGLVIELIHFFNPKSFIHFKKDLFRFDMRLAGESISIGLAPFLVNAVSCIVVIFINKSLKSIGGDISIGAYGIINRITLLFVMVVLGVTQGMQPILGFNYGAKKYDRLKDTLKLGNIIATIIMTAGFILCMFFPHSIARMFTDDEQLIKISVEGVRYSSIAFPIAGIGMVVSNFFQSIGKVGQSILLSLTRQVIFLIPMLIILPPILGTVGVWLSIPISDTASSLLAFFMARKQIRKLTAV